MQKELNIVILPVYKSVLSQNELLSFRRCLKVLGTHPIALVTYAELDCAAYYAMAVEEGVLLLREDFEARFFESVQGYCDLCFNVDFYKRFAKYRYMLIYQLDAYVFRDELDMWCSKGFDYIGAPWMEVRKDMPWFMGMVGNGGFSLRKISKMIKVLRYKGPLYKPYYIFAKYYKHTFKTFLIACLHSIGYKNMNTTVWNEKEGDDVFFCASLQNTWMQLYVPTPYEAALFAFEQIPSQLYHAVGKLPFGCHAWMKFEYEEFWKQYIQ